MLRQIIEVKKEGILLSKTEHTFENEGVLNPAVISDGQDIHLFYRAVSKGNFSSIGYCRLSSPLTIEERWEQPMLSPEQDYEQHGIEDPRIVKIDGLYYLTYTVYDGVNALGAVATSSDLKTWHRHGIIAPQITYSKFKTLLKSNEQTHVKYIRYNINRSKQADRDTKSLIWDKNLLFFPRRINQQLYFLHRIKPDIQLVAGVNNLEELTEQFWENYFNDFNDHILLTPTHPHESSYIGGGCPPIETPAGWLIIYHGVQDSIEGYVYSCCAALLDLNDPQKEIGRLPYPLFFPEEDYEMKGEVDNVCFPSGALVEGDTLYIYYGAADERIAVASVSMTALLAELRNTTTTNTRTTILLTPPTK